MTAAPNPAEHVWWLASRASGLVALVLVTLSVLVGLALGGRVMRRPGWPRMLTAIHEQAAVVGLVAILVHALTLIGDHFLHPGLAGVTIPFAIGYRPLFTAAGIVGAYLAAILGLSFYARRWIGGRRWRAAHRFTIVVYGLAVVHVLGAGTDAGSAWLRGFMVLTGVPILALLVNRLAPARTLRPARKPVADNAGC
jgi:methionine sulfoxide reductase heme-binding subunit